MRKPLLPPDCVERVSRTEAELRFIVPATYEYLKGHFPGTPLVPGVTQVGWALEAIRLLQPNAILAISRYRFVKPILPGAAIRVVATPERHGFSCAVYSDGELASKGVLSESSRQDGV